MFMDSRLRGNDDISLKASSSRLHCSQLSLEGFIERLRPGLIHIDDCGIACRNAMAVLEHGLLDHPAAVADPANAARYINIVGESAFAQIADRNCCYKPAFPSTALPPFIH
jgi:hypothetical protein